MQDKSCGALFNANKIGGGDRPPCVRVKSGTFPEVLMSSSTVNSHTGVSTRNGQDRTVIPFLYNIGNISNLYHMKHWYAMRTTYSRERKAYDYIISKGGTAFLPILTKEKVINGKKETVEVSRIPNIFFVYGTEDEVKEYAYDNIHLPFLRFYYDQHYEGVRIIKEPLIVPERQINSLKILCMAEAEDIRIVPDEIVSKFNEGDSVVVVDGEFKGIEGKVARWHGQQRVAIIIEGLCTIATAYIPHSYLKPQKINKL